jgi:TatD DNase family protein
MNLVDSHCHLDLLDLSAFDGNLDAVIENARAHGVTEMLCVSIRLEEFPKVLALTLAYPNVYGSVGVHPNEREGREATVEELVRLARSGDRIIAIGESGLDYFRSKGDHDWQHERFRRHIRAARETGLPLIVHMRDANEDTLRILREENAGEVGGVMHCFTADLDTALAAVELGFYISFSGIVTFDNAANLKKVAASLPGDRILVETDCPYLTPTPHRGKPNQPAFTRHVAEHIAELRGVPVEQFAEETTQNFHRLFLAAEQRSTIPTR